jgi:exodeoxyribonuclease VII large subunit
VVPDAGVWRAALDKFAARFVRAVTLVRRRDGAAVDNLAKRLQQADPALRMQQAAQRLDELEQRLVGGWRFLAAQARAGLQDLAERLAHCTPELQLERLVQRHALLGVRLERAATQRLQDDANRLALARRGLHAVSPLATLDRGFAIVTREADRKLLRDANEVQPNDVVRARLGRGELRARVLAVSGTAVAAAAAIEGEPKE